jgi:hypothetical protein
MTITVSHNIFERVKMEKKNPPKPSYLKPAKIVPPRGFQTVFDAISLFKRLSLNFEGRERCGVRRDKKVALTVNSLPSFG